VARRVRNFREAGKNIKHPNSKYPWKRWTNLEAWEVKEGTDFTCAPASFIAILRAKGAETGLKLKTRRGKNNRWKTIIVFQFWKSEESETPDMPPKKKYRIVKSKKSSPVTDVVAETPENVSDGAVLTLVQNHEEEPQEAQEEATEQAEEIVEPDSWEDEDSSSEDMEVSPTEDFDSSLVEAETEEEIPEAPEEVKSAPCGTCGRFNGKHTPGCTG